MDGFSSNMPMAVQHNALNAWGRRPTIMAAAASHPMISALDTESPGAIIEANNP